MNLLVISNGNPRSWIADLLQSRKGQWSLRLTSTVEEAIQYSCDGIVVIFEPNSMRSEDTIRGVMSKWPVTPTMLLSEAFDRDVLLLAQTLDVFFALTPPTDTELDAFQWWADRRRRATRQHMHHLLDQLCFEYRLSPREREIVFHAVCGHGRRCELADLLGVTENTVKTTVARILRKSGKSSLGDLASTIHEVIFDDSAVRSLPHQHRLSVSRDVPGRDASRRGTCW